MDLAAPGAKKKHSLRAAHRPLRTGRLVVEARQTQNSHELPAQDRNPDRHNASWQVWGLAAERLLVAARAG